MLVFSCKGSLISKDKTHLRNKEMSNAAERYEGNHYGIHFHEHSKICLKIKQNTNIRFNMTLLRFA